jgi:hypothetical protein
VEEAVKPVPDSGVSNDALSQIATGLILGSPDFLLGRIRGALLSRRRLASGRPGHSRGGRSVSCSGRIATKAYFFATCFMPGDTQVLKHYCKPELNGLDLFESTCYVVITIIQIRRDVTMRLISRPLLKQQQVRRSCSKGTATTSSIQIKKQDAFEFLAELKPASVDLIVSSPPYCMGKAYETSIDTADFMNMHERLAPLLVRALKNGGSLCWQVGHHVHNGVVTPLDALVYAIFSKQEKLLLRNRIIWTFAHGVHASRRFSGRHETVLWFTKGNDYAFNLDAVRVPQKYPGKRHYKGPKKGQLSGNPLGKNPSDVWEIPNVKANHIEKTDHPCQFPVALGPVFS